MGQIIGSAAKPLRCNFQSLSSLGTPSAGEYILVSSDNSMLSTGQGNFSSFIVGDGSTAAIDLPLQEISQLKEIISNENDRLLNNYTLANFTKNYYYAVGATNVTDLTYNSNLYYILKDIPSDCTEILVAGGYADGYLYDTFHAFDSNGNVVYESKYTIAGTTFEVQSTWAKFAVSVIRLGDPVVTLYTDSIKSTISELAASVADEEIQIKWDGVFETHSGFTDFTSGYYFAFGASNTSDLTTNTNCYYLLEDIPSDCVQIFVSGSYNGSYIADNFHAFDSNGNVVYESKYAINGTTFEVQSTWVKYAVSIVRLGSPLIKLIADNHLQVVEDLIDEKIAESESKTGWELAQTRQEIMLRDALYGLSRANEFAWGTFDNKYISFSCDDALSGVCDYYAELRNRRMPFVPVWIPDMYDTYTYTGVDATRENIIKEPVVGVEYTFSTSLSYIHVYIDRRCELNFPIVLMIGSTSYTITSADNARFAVNSSTTLQIVSINGDSTEQICKYICIHATNDSTDSASNSASWTQAEVLRNIVFDFGEILAHGSSVINSTDPLEREEMIADYLYSQPQVIDDMLGFEHCKGFILPGGPNSFRGMHTLIGQKYCLRCLLYCDYLGTSPQYSIVRTPYGQVVSGYDNDVETCQTNATTWLNNKSNGFYPLFGHEGLTAEKVGAIADACIDLGLPVHTWNSVYELFAD